MTRLQSRSCECGKTTKESRPFVTKTKIYETRSSGRKDNEKTVYKARRCRRFSNEVNIKEKLCVSKTNCSVERMPRRKSFNGHVNVKKSRIKSEDKGINKDETTQLLIGSAIDGLISRNLKMDIIESACVNGSNGNLNDFALATDFAEEIVSEIKANFSEQPPTPAVMNYDVRRSTEFVENSVPLAIAADVVEHSKEEMVHVHRNTENSLIKAPELQKQMSINENIKDETAEAPDESVGKKRRKSRKTQFQSLIEYCSEVNICSTNVKRQRKVPPSMVLSQSKNYIYEKTVKSSDRSMFKLSGELKKKCGRKPKPKGPVLHYLDCYMKKKEKHISIKKISFNNGDTDIIHERPLKEEIELDKIAELKNDSIMLDSFETRSETCTESHAEDDNKPDAHTSDDQNFFSDIVDVPAPCKPVVKRKKKRRIVPIKKKVSFKPFDGSISKILGHRSKNGKNELLVLFDNGTSNWIDENVDGTKLFEKLKKFYCHPDQDLSVIHRTGYKVVNELARKRTESETTDHLNFDDELSVDDVFSPGIEYFEKPLSVPIPVNSVQQHDNAMLNMQSTATNGLEELFKLSKQSSHNEENRFKDFSEDNDIDRHEQSPDRDLNDLCGYVLSSRHKKLYPFETTKDLIVKTDGEFVHVYLKRVNRKLDNCKRASDRLNIEACEQLINILEDCCIDADCNVVVMSGIEDFFALSNVFEKLLKRPASIEGKSYEQDISILRYLVQTIRNFTKPIAAVIKKTAMGLPASMLSLFDLVFDERSADHVTKDSTVLRKRTKVKHDSVDSPKTRHQASSPKTKARQQPNSPKTHGKRQSCSPKATAQQPLASSGTDGNSTDDQSSCEALQSYVFPRLMGLTERNEAQIMGEQQKYAIDLLASEGEYDSYCNKNLSQQLRNSVRHMRKNTKIQMKKVSRSSESASAECDDAIPVEENGSRSGEANDLSTSAMKDLEKQIELEKDLAKQCMLDLSSFLQSLETNVKAV